MNEYRKIALPCRLPVAASAAGFGLPQYWLKTRRHPPPCEEMDMQDNRRRVLRQIGFGMAAGALGSLGAGMALAQAARFPSRPVRVIYPFTPGGLGDAAVRAIFEQVGAAWGQSVIIDNRAGAGGMIGADAVAK